MSTFGLLVTFFSLVFLGGSILLYYADSHRVKLARFCMFGLFLIIFLELILALFEFPAKIFDAIIFISMGMENIAKIMILIVLIAIIFVLFLIIPKINWRRALRTTPVKMIVCGVLLIGLLIYTEAYNGRYSFENKDDFYTVRQMYEKYDENFWPVKLIETDNQESDGTKHVSVYPFDATTGSGKQPLAYKITVYRRFENGDYVLYYYPFTYKTYVDGVSYSMDAFVDFTPEEEDENFSETDISYSDLSGTDLSETDISDTDIAE